MPKEGSFINQKADESFYVCPEGKLSDGEVQSSSSMNACNITVGDINNDGYDDIVVAGIKAEIDGYGETDESYLAYTTLLNNKTMALFNLITKPCQQTSGHIKAPMAKTLFLL